MKYNPYARFAESNLVLSDELAIDRTLLAIDRTLLAYLRSAVALLITGVSIIHFSTQWWFLLFGFICVPGSLLITIIGVARYRKMSKTIWVIRDRTKNNHSQGH